MPESAPPPPAPARPFADLASSQLIRLLLIGFLILLLQIPLTMVRGLISERAALRDGAIAEISESWGGRQTLDGPVLVVPYRRHWKEESGGRSIARSRICYAHFLPETLAISGDLEGESRYRGIFEVPVYRARIDFRGRFAKPSFEGWVVNPEDILWDRAQLVVSVSDARAIRNAARLEWGGETLDFLPGRGALASAESGDGFHVPLEGAAAALAEGLDFAFDLDLQGSHAFRVGPFAKQTRVELRSDWTDPSFRGAWLPSSRAIDETGFTASWDVPFLGRSFPQRWTDSEDVAAAIERSHFGVDLATMVDEYRMAERSAKYGMLFLALTFAALWLFEVVQGIRVHSIQYLMVGGGLCLFYLLELSLAEHLGFTLAYTVASSAVVALVAGYCVAVLGGRARAAAIASVLVALYGYLFVLLRDQDYALVVGSIGLFGALALVMFLTRHVDWASLGRQPRRA